MKKHIGLLCIALCCMAAASAQGFSPVEWEFTSEKVGDHHYEVHISADMEYPWRIYSQHTDEGGPLPTVIAFGENQAVKPEGEIREEGSLIEKYEEVFMVNARYYQGSVDFVQRVSVKDTPQTLNGSVTFMACTDEQCLTPREVKFSIRLN